jgi:hypothetical protein
MTGCCGFTAAAVLGSPLGGRMSRRQSAAIASLLKPLSFNRSLSIGRAIATLLPSLHFAEPNAIRSDDRRLTPNTPPSRFVSDLPFLAIDSLGHFQRLPHIQPADRATFSLFPDFILLSVHFPRLRRLLNRDVEGNGRTMNQKRHVHVPRLKAATGIRDGPPFSVVRAHPTFCNSYPRCGRSTSPHPVLVVGELGGV